MTLPWILTLSLVAGAARASPPADDDAPLREAFPTDDFTLTEALVPMRDGVKLYTLIATPKTGTGPRPILLTRTPYDATRFLGSRATTSLEVMRGRSYAGDGYIYVTQDIRGRYKSEGEYAMYRVPRGEFNRTDTDETTDAWDTIEWLVKNVPGQDGRVAIWGTSYPGWLALAALREPHPALVAAVVSNPVVDVWKADDWFHWGAFRMAYAFEFIYDLETRPGASSQYPYPTRDLYAWYLGLGSAQGGAGALLDARHEMWQKLMQYPAYGPYWKDCAADQWFERPPARLVPTLHVHGQWDQEDIYGAPAVYAALERYDAGNDANFLAIGPWSHGGHFRTGDALGPLTFDEDTAKRFREDVLIPFFGRFVRGENMAPPAPVTAFETGTNRWRHFDRWPAIEQARNLYLHAGGGLDFTPPRSGEPATEYVSDPAKPVPQAPRPFLGVNYDDERIIKEWRAWLTEDQRFVDGRPDVATWVSAPLERDLALRGAPVAKLYAATTGTDADWVVKLIDVFPGQDPEQAERGGLQVMIASDIFRGRYRESFTEPRALEPDKVLEYRIPLPHANHVFRRGHRLMVQIQSSWFPLYDRNPQTFVPSIMSAPPEAYRAQRQRVHHEAAFATRLELPLAEN
jgi:putative CocE/NonD family hydrolase